MRDNHWRDNDWTFSRDNDWHFSRDNHWRSAH
jgi:hypothetical protein